MENTSEHKEKRSAEKFKIVCNVCNSDDVDISSEIGYAAPDMPYAVIVINCNFCGNKK